jgi:probable phosphoglycerate mutase
MIAYCDGARRGSHTTPGECSAAFAVFNGSTLYASEAFYLGPGTNNFAEYQGLIRCLRWANENGVMNLVINSDSQLMVRQVNGEWQVKHEDLKPLYSSAYALLIRGGHTLQWVRGHSGNVGNELCDRLCNEELDRRLNGQGNGKDSNAGV